MKTLEISAKITILSELELNKDQKNVVEAAKNATLTSYSPYSHFSVGAACLLDNGEIVAGSNQENAAYPSGLCAERTALFYAMARYPKAKVLKLAIISRNKGRITPDICTPCGACRQVILETEARGGQPIELLLCSDTEIYVVNGISSLLPLGFNYESLQK